MALGQFSMPFDKRQPYETDIRVPLLMLGPGVPTGDVKYPASSVDLFSTIMDMAGLDAPSDGTSLLSHYLHTDRTVLIEYRGEKSNRPQSSGCPTDNDPDMTVTITIIHRITLFQTLFRFLIIMYTSV